MPCAGEIQDIESIGSKNSNGSVSVESMMPSNHVSPPNDVMEKFMTEFIQVVNSQVAKKSIAKEVIDEISNKLRRKYRIIPSKHDIRNAYQSKFTHIQISLLFQKWMIKCAARSDSGVLVVTITLSPHKFSCKYDCFYCPQETDLKGVPTQPRSYLSTEPAMQRAIGTRTSNDTYDFDLMNQFRNRIATYNYNGNASSNASSSKKLEVILSGGTWESYPIEYREQVINEVYWAANTIGQETARPIKSLLEEQKENETAGHRVIGLTLETRPDNITEANIKDYLRWGVTRIQIGVQHFDDAILKKINRKCYTTDTIRAIRLLKQVGLKVVIHLMPDLPGSSPELDSAMLARARTDPDLAHDDEKLYPTAICKSPDPDRIVSSKIADWYNEGKYMPYAEANLDSLIDVLSTHMANISPWVRIERVVRDIPKKSITAGYNKMSNLRQMILDKMKKRNQKSLDIFSMEIGDNELDESLTPLLVVRKYAASQGTEYHLSFEAHKMSLFQTFVYNLTLFINHMKYLITGRRHYWSGNLDSYLGVYGFLRLRIDPNPGGDFVPEINYSALIREVHVYGSSLSVGTEAIGSQHRGFGKLLVKTAEEIAFSNGMKKIAVIAGVGTREYYKNKCGYTLGSTYMLKDLVAKASGIVNPLLPLFVGMMATSGYMLLRHFMI
jgi:ELP3 family radical SAM enzyme/protein acetyltransferase